MQVGRLGASVPLPNGAPVNACEVHDWRELAPTRVIAEGTTTGGLVTTQYTAVVEGQGVYRPGEKEPLDLVPLLPAMGEPDLARAHMAPIENVDDKEAAVLGWTLGSLGGMGLGLGIAAGIGDKNPTAAAVAGVSGLAFGLVALVVALASQPSGDEQLRADAYRHVFVPKLEDWTAVQRGVDHLNTARRQQCGGGAAAVARQKAATQAPAPAKSE